MDKMINVFGVAEKSMFVDIGFDTSEKKLLEKGIYLQSRQYYPKTESNTFVGKPLQQLEWSVKQPGIQKDYYEKIRGYENVHQFLMSQGFVTNERLNSQLVVAGTVKTTRWQLNTECDWLKLYIEAYTSAKRDLNFHMGTIKILLPEYSVPEMMLEKQNLLEPFNIIVPVRNKMAQMLSVQKSSQYKEQSSSIQFYGVARISYWLDPLVQQRKMDFFQRVHDWAEENNIDQTEGDIQEMYALTVLDSIGTEDEPLYMQDWEFIY